MSTAERARRPHGTMGTFAGVFTPSIVTILGIILFLRLGYVVGAAGLGRALAIIALANLISILTSVSLSAIATNLRVKGGGDYYVISRTLGVEYGGALGIVLFLAQSVSIAFYSIGFGEVVTTAVGSSNPLLPQIVAAAAVGALFFLAWLGADWATRFQYVVMGVLFVSIAGFFIGGAMGWDANLARDNLAPGSSLPFWGIFAIFFPAVTGFTQGVSMSGELKDPGRSLPLGTFLAVGISALVYVGVAVVFAGALPGEVLFTDYHAMRKVALLPWLVGAGVIAATLSSALASFLGAPRILQSLAGDRVFPFLDPFAKGHGPANNPRRGVLLSLAIAVGTIALGELNVIAPVVSMFFLISYGLLNYATYVEARAKSPSFRPRFKWFHARLSLAGAVGCLGAMLAIHPAAGAIAVALLFGLYQYVSRTSRVERWADSDRSRRVQRVREDLYAIGRHPDHPRYWRPVVLAFSDDPERRQRLLRFASWLEGEAGFTTIVRIVESEGPAIRRIQEDNEKELQAEIDKGPFPAFARAVVTADPDASIPVVLQAHGLGRVRANTVLLNWFDHAAYPDVADVTEYGRWLRVALRFGCNIVALSATPSEFEAIENTRPEGRRIDVWYRENATGRLALLLAYLMTRTPAWEVATIRLLVPVSKEADHDKTLEEISTMLGEVRIDAKPEIVVEPDHLAVVERSANSTAVLLPFRLADAGPASVFDGSLEETLRALGITALVLASQDIQLDSEPEAGEYAERAGAVDAAERARKHAAKAEAEAAKAVESAQKGLAEVEKGRASGAAAGELAKIEKAARAAEEEAERAKRRAARAKAKAETAEDEAESITGQPMNKEDDGG
ncbi:MAG: amino acid permease [Acidobacteriota bacterium]|nr:amino acid permease [Acidobacteriota bacterium]